MCKKLFLIASVLMLVGNPLAMAATRTWDHEGGDNRWDTAQNWSGSGGGIIPGTTDHAHIIMAGADYALIDILVTANVNTVKVGWMKSDLTQGAAGELLMTGGTLNWKGNSKVGIRTTGEFTIQGGTVTSAGNLDVGDDGDGTLVVSSGGSVDIGSAGSAKNLKVGKSGGTGSIDISGESTDIDVWGTMTVGTGLGSDGTLTMSDGTLDVGAPDNAENFRIGFKGATGTATISGGTINATGNLNIGASVDGDSEVGGVGTLEVLLDGIINVGNVNTIQELRVGRNRGTGVLEMYGGTINVINGDALVGSTFFQTVEEVEIPRPGTGTLTMTGGLLSISDANSLKIGIDGSTGLVELHGGTIETGGLEIGVPGSGGTLDFEIGGLLILDGNQMLTVLDYIEDGLFTVYGSAMAADWFGWSYGYNACGYDGKTFVGVTEIPEPATIALLGLGGLALLRIRKRR